MALEATFAVCRLAADAAVPDWAQQPGELSNVTRTGDELSIVCEQRWVPADTQHEGDWRALRVPGPLDFGLTGILAKLTTALAKADVSVFAVSTFDTDYLLVKDTQLAAAQSLLAEI